LNQPSHRTPKFRQNVAVKRETKKGRANSLTLSTKSSQGLATLFSQARCLAGAAPEEIEVLAAHVGAAQDFNLFHQRRTSQKGPLDPNAMSGNPPHGKIRVISAASNPDHRAGNHLNPLSAAFHNPQMDANLVTGPQIGHIWILWCLQRSDKLI
jgi:hypothetical protein